MNIHERITDLVGSTPLLKLTNYMSAHDLTATLLVKPEGLNPGGSAKDRVALQMINDAVQRGALAPGGMIIEPTSGNTGIGLAMAAAALGYQCIIVMPDSASVERRLLMEAYGAQVVLTPGHEGMKGCIAKAEELSAANPGSFIPGQFDNPANPAAHYATTGPEIWQDTDGQVDVFVAGVGTGGTITGVARYLRERNPNLRVVGVEPADSPLLTKGYAAPHPLQGIGANFVPSVLDLSLIDEIIPATGEDAYATGRELARKEGLLCGITSGAAVWAAAQLARRPEYPGKTIIALLPDSGERYLSTAMFRD